MWSYNYTYFTWSRYLGIIVASRLEVCTLNSDGLTTTALPIEMYRYSVMKNQLFTFERMYCYRRKGKSRLQNLALLKSKLYY